MSFVVGCLKCSGLSLNISANFVNRCTMLNVIYRLPIKLWAKSEDGKCKGCKLQSGFVMKDELDFGIFPIF